MSTTINTLSDFELVSLMDGGNEKAFKELYNRHTTATKDDCICSTEGAPVVT